MIVKMYLIFLISDKSLVEPNDFPLCK